MKIFILLLTAEIICRMVEMILQERVLSQLAESLSSSGLVADPLQGSTYHLAAQAQW